MFLTSSKNGHFGRFRSLLPKCVAPNQMSGPTLSDWPSPSRKSKRLCDSWVFIYGPYQIPSTEGVPEGPGTCPHQPPKNVSRARFGHVLYVIRHRFVRYNKRLIITSGRRGNGGSKTRLQNGVFLEGRKMGIFWSWVFEME